MTLSQKRVVLTHPHKIDMQSPLFWRKYYLIIPVILGLSGKPPGHLDMTCVDENGQKTNMTRHSRGLEYWNLARRLAHGKFPLFLNETALVGLHSAHSLQVFFMVSM